MIKNSKEWHSDFSRRSSGILLPLTSLPGEHGSGDLGPEANHFLAFLEKAGQSWWQMLPVGPPGREPAYSPYDSTSTFAGSSWLVSITLLARDGLLTPEDIKPIPELSRSEVNFPATIRYREERLRKAFAGFRQQRGESGRAFLGFCKANSDWLEDFALFMALRHESDGKPWTNWDKDIRTRQPSAIQAAGMRLAEEVALHRFIQFQFNRQWQSLKEQSHRHGIGLIGDLPIFVAHDSADVWCNQELFQLDYCGQPTQTSGYPPDRFNRKGQSWGHPQFNWTLHQQSDFSWWVMRFKRMYELFDAVRIDHFLGFTRTWSIPGHASGARSGQWVKSPGNKLFSTVRQILGPRPMIAEDLGLVTPADIQLRDKFGLAPSRIFQFGFGGEVDSACHLPHNYPPICAAYSGTHDNYTIVEWFRKLPPDKRHQVLAYTGGRTSTIHWDILRTLQSSGANLVICPLQDILGLDIKGRMNVPGTVSGNWKWRLNSNIKAATVKKLRLHTKLYGRSQFRQISNTKS